MQKRVVIVDVNHLVHMHYHSRVRLSTKVKVDGEYIEKDTTILNGVLKSLFRWSKGGSYPLVVCFDRPVPARKAFFQTYFPDMKIGSGNEYKGNRERMPEAMWEGISDVESVLRQAGVTCLAQTNYESDDLVYAAVKRAKVLFPDYPIDVITNDADLLPLVDDRVSVFIRSKVGTYAVSSSIEKAHYIQVTPDNFQEVVERLSAYKGYIIPYNALLLHKLLRGDPSDMIHRKDISIQFSPKRWNAMMENMIADYVNFEEVFRYGEPQYKILYKGTNEEFHGTLQDALASPDRDKLYQKICNTEEIDVILELLRQYSSLTEEQLDSVEKVYWGMNLNQVYPNANKQLARKAYVVGAKGNPDIHQYDEMLYRESARTFQINLGNY